jgi:hypothetical protein
MGHPEKVSELATWYDGYDFGGQAIYNPWSVLNYLRDGCVAQPYWTNTSSNDVVRGLIGRASESINEQLTTLAEGSMVAAPLDLSVVYGHIDSATSAIWPQLYLAGYVTTHDVSEPNDVGVPRRLEVPNLEVRKLFIRELMERAATAAGDRDALARLHEALVSGDENSLVWELEEALLTSVSYHDLCSENSCHMWLLSLRYGMSGYRFPRSNREVGRGRPDVVCEPDAAHEKVLPAIVVEVKFAKVATKDELEALAKEALYTQVLRRRYEHGLTRNDAVLWSVAFDGKKNVAVKRA